MENQTELMSTANPTTLSDGLSIVGRVAKGLGALSLNGAVQIVGQLTIVPVALYAWGKIRYGEWLVLTGLVTFLRLTDLGLQTFVVNRLCANYARDERDEMETVLHNALRIQIPLVVGTFAIAAIALVTLPMNRILALETVGGRTVTAVALLLVFELLINVPMGVINGIYRATGRLPRSAIITSCQQFAIMALCIGLIALHSSFVGLAIARVAVVLVTSAWIIYDLHRLYPWLDLWGDGDWKEGLLMIGPGVFFIIIPIADYLSNQFSLIVLQRVLAGGEVSRLATHRTVVNVAVMLSGLLTSAMWPELTSLHARSQREQLMKAHRSLARLNMWLVSAVLFGMLPFLPMVYRAWTGGRLGLDGWTLGILISRGLLWALWISSVTVLCSINRQKPVAYALVASAVLSCILAVALIPSVGIRGAALAQVTGDLCISAWLIPFLAVRETGDRFSHFLGATAAGYCKAVLVPFAFGMFGWRLIQSDRLRFFILVPVTWCLALGLMWLALSQSERSHLIRLGKTRVAH